MKIFHSFTKFLFIFTSLFVLFWVNEVFASDYLTQINSSSNEQKVKKLQNIFLELGLYNWKVDWKFESIKDELITYQVKNNIVSHSNHDEAGYFWKRTIKSLEKKYPNKFLSLKEKYLKIEEMEINKEGYFMVTAYYTPVKWQNKYQRWSYEADIRLNGRWITASWKKPFPWALALPRNYKFGTKIYLEWVWVWVVEDRGWAIVNSGEKWQSHDRIDIWVGYGDEWRERAIKWWRRKVKWYVTDSSREISIEFDRSKLAKYSWLKVDAENPKKENVTKLQDLFKEVWLYKWKITWVYEDIKDELIAYQKSKWIKNHLWYFWNKTYDLLKKDYWVQNWLFVNRREEKLDIEKFSLLSKKEKQNIELVKTKIIKILKKKTKNSNELKSSINWFKTKVEKMIPAMREEKQKVILAYLIQLM